MLDLEFWLRAAERGRGGGAREDGQGVRSEGPGPILLVSRTSFERRFSDELTVIYDRIKCRDPPLG